MSFWLIAITFIEKKKDKPINSVALSAIKEQHVSFFKFCSSIIETPQMNSNKDSVNQHITIALIGVLSNVVQKLYKLGHSNSSEVRSPSTT